MTQKFKSGFVGIVGAPNVGKSTFLNRILGQKISIISDKPQTTRNRILGVLHRQHSQIIFLDTPGVHTSSKELNLRMVEKALSAVEDVDIVLLMIDVSKPDPNSEQLLIDKLKNRTKPLIIALNKIDLIQKQKLLPMIEHWNNICQFSDIFPISSLKGDYVDELLIAMEKLLKEGPPYFPKDTITDMPERFIAAEMIREKIFRYTSQEIPYSTAVTIESFKEDKKKNLLKINAKIHVERDSQKGIIIGKKGSRLKEIGQKSRKDIERMTGIRVFLSLFVSVQKNWSNDSICLRNFGY